MPLEKEALLEQMERLENLDLKDCKVFRDQLVYQEIKASRVNLERTEM